MQMKRNDNKFLCRMSVVETSAGTGGSLLLSQPIVIDNGTATIKAGFAGSSRPKVSNNNKCSLYCFT
jgi:predicted methyltransferase MtxX (methanogen marker protein 4)